MPSYYTVVRFVPSALAEEFANIGVLTFGDGKVRGKFLDNWSRVAQFADATSLEHARGFQQWVEESMVPDAPSYQRLRPLDEPTLHKLITDWSGSIQLSAPRASLLEPDDLLEDIASTFLVEPAGAFEAEAETAPRERAADKRWMVAAVRASLRNAILHRLPADLHMSVQTRWPLAAQVRNRTFDIVVANGAPRHAVQCFNFKIADTKKVLDQVDAAAFAIEDVRRKLGSLRVSVIANASSTASAAIAQARSTFEAVDATFVNETDMPVWSETVVQQLAADFQVPLLS